MNSSFQQIYEHGLAMKGEEFANSILDVIRVIHGKKDECIIIKSQSVKSQCMARSANGKQCSRKAKNGEFCGLHGNYELPRRCGRCSTKKKDVFHSSKWEHHGRIDMPKPIHTSSTGEVVLKGPKRAKTSYLLYTQSIRSIVSSNNPGLSPQDMTRKLASMWSNLSAEERKPFEEQAQIERDEYAKARDAWKERKKLIKKANKKNDKTKPKRKKTSYLSFIMKERPNVMSEFPDLSPQDVTRELGKRWSSLSDEEKGNYQLAADEDEFRFRKEMEQWNFERSESHSKTLSGNKDPIILEEKVVNLCREPIMVDKEMKDDETDDESEEEIIYNADSDDDVF